MTLASRAAAPEGLAIPSSSAVWFCAWAVKLDVLHFRKTMLKICYTILLLKFSTVWLTRRLYPRRHYTIKTLTKTCLSLTLLNSHHCIPQTNDTPMTYSIIFYSRLLIRSIFGTSCRFTCCFIRFQAHFFNINCPLLIGTTFAWLHKKFLALYMMHIKYHVRNIFCSHFAYSCADIDSIIITEPN